MITEDELEERAVAPRITLKEVEESILFTYFFTAAEGIRGHARSTSKMAGKASNLEKHTFCVIILRNGFTVTGESACADPANYQQDIGEHFAKADALKKVWPLLAYELKTKLDQGIK